MTTLSPLNKIKIFKHYICNRIKSNLFPYEKVIIDGEKEKHEKHMNNYSCSLCFFKICCLNKCFGENKRVLLEYIGEKHFITSFFAESYDEIHLKIKNITKSFEEQKYKIVPNLPFYFIENVYFVCGEKKFNIIDILDVCVYLDSKNDSSITFGDIAKLKLKCENINFIDFIDFIEVIYCENLKQKNMIIKYAELENCDVSYLNIINKNGGNNLPY